MFGLGELFSLTCAICWAIAIVLFKHSGESLSANALNLCKNLIGLSLLLPTALLIEGLSFPELSVSHWLILVASGYFGIAVADSWYFQALRNLGAGRTAIVASLYSPFVILLSFIILGERLALWQWLGFILVIMGILIVVYQRKYKQVDNQHLYKGIAYAAASVFLTALGVVLMKPILEKDGFFWLVCLRLLAGIVGMLIYLAYRKQLKPIIHDMRYQKHNWRNIIVASIFGTYLAMLFWLGGFKYADASVASVLNETANMFIVLFAWIFLKEHLSKRKLIGVALTFCGVAIFIGI